MSFRQFIRYGSLMVILLGTAWLLRPPPDEHHDDAQGAAAKGPRQDARFELKIAPGSSYLPGTQPFGLT